MPAVRASRVLGADGQSLSLVWIDTAGDRHKRGKLEGRRLACDARHHLVGAVCVRQRIQRTEPHNFVVDNDDLLVDVPSGVDDASHRL
jgi:hypothetical protein